MPNPTPPKDYTIVSSIHVPADTKMSPDIEDRREWGPIRNAVGKQKQDFLDYWRDFHKTYPDFHTAYNVVKDAIMGNKASPIAMPNTQPIDNISGFETTAPPIPKVGQEKRFANGKIATWDGHGWIAK